MLDSPLVISQHGSMETSKPQQIKDEPSAQELSNNRNDAQYGYSFSNGPLYFIVEELKI